MAKYIKRNDGRYQTRVYLGLNNEGKKMFKYIYAYSPKELTKMETDIRAQINKGVDITSMDDTFEQWYNRLKSVKKIELTDSEYQTFCFRVSYFSEKVGNLPLKHIDQHFSTFGNYHLIITVFLT